MGQRVALLGGGKMGEALLAGMLRAGRTAADVVVTERHAERAAELRDRYGVSTADAVEAVKTADVILLAIKPQDMASLLGEIGDVVRPDQLVISVAAGIPTAFMERHFGAEVPVVRVMSNTAVFVDEAMSAISAGAHATGEHMKLTEGLLTPVGEVIRVPESQLDAVTALSGSGPAYFFYLVEAMTDAGILLGLPREVAYKLIVQTAVGSARMLKETGEHPVKLREAVMSPAGTTIAAIRKMEDHGVRAAMIAALEAARDRSRELASGHG
ncbi:pyrroline-5-carboxylate reductase [Sporichthya sp.]|uniref:pyrroline-5-carboxylate reductase n=1 Tax=Sporichthya sp. TaxID=65475 RepID=UPI001808616B|nr:pyrroline-5-carboxylate reductase [Sporichthya sp.]MBA3745497.1 pyrroline-5-carboxylate reductase [Sporichthya sp.]